MDMKHLPRTSSMTAARLPAAMPVCPPRARSSHVWSRSSCMHSTKSPSRVSRCSPTMGSFPRRTNSARSSW